MNKQQLKDLGYKVFAYVAIYIIINLYMKSDDAFDFENWYYIGNVGATSIVYLIIFLGSDSVGYRLKDDNELKTKLEKMTISKKAMIAHGVVIAISLVISILIGGIFN